MIDIVTGIIFLAMGFTFAVFHRRLARFTDKFWFKVMGIHYGEQIYQIGFLFGGIVFMVYGIVTLFQIIRFGQ